MGCGASQAKAAAPAAAQPRRFSRRESYPDDLEQVAIDRSNPPSEFDVLHTKPQFVLAALAMRWKARAGKAAAKKLEVSGYHGCPFFGVASSAAVELLKRGVVTQVVIRRAGHIHCPNWAAEGNKAIFAEYVKGMPTSASWTGASPRIVIDDEAESAMGGPDMMVQYAAELKGFAFRLKSISWEEGTAQAAIGVVLSAYSSGLVERAFLGDPVGPARLGVDMGGGLRFEDLDEEGFEYLPFAKDAPFSGYAPNTPREGETDPADAVEAADDLPTIEA